MAKDEAGKSLDGHTKEVTVRHVLQALENIERWVLNVKIAMSGLDNNMILPKKNDDLHEIAHFLRTKKNCPPPS